MTAEIAILNSTGVALAADSAITIGRDRVWKSSNKLFHLAPNADVAVMIYGNGSYCGIPWEVLVKSFRQELGPLTFDHLQEYTQKFLGFIDGVKLPEAALTDLNLWTLFSGILQEVGDDVHAIKKKTDRRKKLVDMMAELQNKFEDYEIVFSDYPFSDFVSQHEKVILELLKDIIDVRATKTVCNAVLTALFEATRRTVETGADTGIVFAGFGDKEMLPVVQEICVDGEVDGKARAWTKRLRNTNLQNSGGTIMPFAQSDIAHLFIEGLLPEYVDYMSATLNQTLDRKSSDLVKSYVPAKDQLVETRLQEKENSAMTEEFQKQFREFRQKAAISPMLKVVNSLPKEEMAALAEALVETTSLRRKMDSRLETVGGPVDVAIVSKSDGFVWIKRKHYFDIELNTDFSERRAARYAGGQKHGRTGSSGSIEHLSGKTDDTGPDDTG